MICIRFLVAVAILATPAWSAQESEVPDSLAALMRGAHHMAPTSMDLGDQPFRSVGKGAELPFLVWPATKAAQRSVAYDRTDVLSWLEAQRASLRLDDLTFVDLGTEQWLDDEVWRFGLEHRGLEIFDAFVRVHWRDGALVGLIRDLPGEVVDVDAQQLAPRGGERLVWMPVREGRGIRLTAARLVQSTRGGKPFTEVFNGSSGTQMYRSQGPIQFRPDRRLFERFQEYNVPAGSFPDQIDVDSNGVVWFSQPNNDWTTSFHPGTETFTQYPTKPSGPDGLFVDSKDHVWTGLYYSGALGKLNANTKKERAFPAPYSPAAMAIPVETKRYTLWVTDHAYNRISEFDPTTKQWLQSLVMPTSNCWVVEGALDRRSGDIYFTENFVDKLGRVTPSGQLTDFPVSGGGPAFPIVHKGIVYYTLWDRARLGAYDIATGTITDYDFPVSGEIGGPIAKTPDGRIVAGTRNRGFIFVFDPDTQSFQRNRIPTASPGLKDGLTVAPNGVVWFTETYTNKLAKLEPKPKK